ncbi:MAG: acetyl-CoA carboxylase, carboxyltransferase subunit beta [Pseudonocardiaceae bacterium]
MTSTMSRPLMEDVPPSWIACERCRSLNYRRRLEREMWVCPACGQHLRLSATQRMRMLLDPGSAQPLTPATTVCDPLDFTDTRDYRKRLRLAQETTGLEDAVLTAAGTIDGQPVVVAVMDFTFLGGSLGVAAGEAVVAAAEHALSTRTPLLLVTASGGARMQEGLLALLQMAKTSNAMATLDSAGILTISLITDPTYGGVAASFATLSDIVLCEPAARLGFAGPRVIEQTIGQRLPKGFQTAEFLLEHGLVDNIRPRNGLRATLAVLLAAANRRTAVPSRGGPAPVATVPEQLDELDPAKVLTLARHTGRPTMTDHLAQWMDGFVELHGDRAGGGDCSSIICGIGLLDGRGVMMIGHQKGHSTQEMVRRNFGMASPAGYRKAARMMRLAAKIGIPIVTLVDTPGAHPGLDAERHGQASAIAECLRVLGSVPVPVVSVITGEGGSGGALALASADRVLMCRHAIYSVISPEGCAAILWKDSSQRERAARALRVDARSLLTLGVVDGVVDEPAGGAHTDPVAASLLIRDAVLSTLNHLEAVGCTELIRQRHRRYRELGRDLQNTAVA